LLSTIKGSVKVWDPRQKNDPVATMEPGEGESKRDCWTVAFGMYAKLQTSYFKLTIKLWTTTL